jgi:hypothetical protein
MSARVRQMFRRQDSTSSSPNYDSPTFAATAPTLSSGGPEEISAHPLQEEDDEKVDEKLRDDRSYDQQHGRSSDLPADPSALDTADLDPANRTAGGKERPIEVSSSRASTSSELLFKDLETDPFQPFCCRCVLQTDEDFGTRLISTVDDVNIPIHTLRMYVIGLGLTCFAAVLGQIFYLCVQAFSSVCVPRALRRSSALFFAMCRVHWQVLALNCIVN